MIEAQQLKVSHRKNGGSHTEQKFGGREGKEITKESLSQEL